jgi:hypothetical protein
MRQSELEIILVDEALKPLEERVIGGQSFVIAKAHQEYLVKVRVYRNKNGQFPCLRFRVGLTIDSVNIPYWKRVDLTTLEPPSTDAFVECTFVGYKKNAKDLRCFQFTTPSRILSAGEDEDDSAVGSASAAGAPDGDDEARTRGAAVAGYRPGTIRATVYACEVAPERGVSKNGFRFYEVPSGHIRAVAPTAAALGGASSAGAVGPAATLDPSYASLVTKAGRGFDALYDAPRPLSKWTHTHTSTAAAPATTASASASTPTLESGSGAAAAGLLLQAELSYHSKEVVLALEAQEQIRTGVYVAKAQASAGGKARAGKAGAGASKKKSAGDGLAVAAGGRGRSGSSSSSSSSSSAGSSGGGGVEGSSSSAPTGRLRKGRRPLTSQGAASDDDDDGDDDDDMLDLLDQDNGDGASQRDGSSALSNVNVKAHGKRSAEEIASQQGAATEEDDDIGGARSSAPAAAAPPAKQRKTSAAQKGK